MACSKGIPPVVTILSTVLQLDADRNDTMALFSVNKPQLTPITAEFSGGKTLQTSVHDYLRDICLNMDISSSCYVLAYVYIRRFLDQQGSFVIRSFNVHRFLLAAVITAVKFMDTRYVSNGQFARVGGIPLHEMNKVELRFLFGLRFDLYISPMTFYAHCSDLQTNESFLLPSIPRPLHHILSEKDQQSSRGGSSSLSQQRHTMAELKHLLFHLKQLNV